MRIHTLYIAAIVAAMNVLTACGPEIVTTERVIEKDVFVCSDEAHTRTNDPRTCPPGPVTRVTEYVCVSNGQTVADANQCPEVMVECPEGTTPFVHDGLYTGCDYVNTCHEGWAYEPSSETCKKYCSIGEMLTPDGLNCEAIPPKELIYVGRLNPDMKMTNESHPGEGALLVQLNIRGGERDVSLNDSAFTLYLSLDPNGTSSTWDNRLPVLQQFIESCWLLDAGNGNVTQHVALTSIPGTEDTLVAFDPAVGSGKVQNINLLCKTKASIHVRFRLAAVLYSVRISDTATGETLTNLAFGSTNAGFASQALITPIMPTLAPCVGLRVMLASGSPSGSAYPGFSEVLRYNVSVPDTCHDIQVSSVKNTIVNTGWYTDGQVRLTESYDPSTPRLSNIMRQPNNGVIYTNDAPGDEDDAFIAAGNTSTFSLRIDSSNASAADDDVLRVDITGFCYKDMVTLQEYCLDQTNTIVTGGTQVF